MELITLTMHLTSHFPFHLSHFPMNLRSQMKKVRRQVKKMRRQVRKMRNHNRNRSIPQIQSMLATSQWQWQNIVIQYRLSELEVVNLRKSDNKWSSYALPSRNNLKKVRALLKKSKNQRNKKVSSSLWVSSRKVKSESLMRSVMKSSLFLRLGRWREVRRCDWMRTLTICSW